MKRTFYYRGRKIFLSKMEGAELKDIGITEEAIELNYCGSDCEYYRDSVGNVYEVLNNAIQGCWNLSTFVEWFNCIDEIGG